MSDEINDAPLKHIRRHPLPWRDSGLSECGRAATSFAPEILLTAEDADALIKKHGPKRAAFLLCMTCLDRFRGWLLPYPEIVAERVYQLAAHGLGDCECRSAETGFDGIKDAKRCVAASAVEGGQE